MCCIKTGEEPASPSCMLAGRRGLILWVLAVFVLLVLRLEREWVVLCHGTCDLTYVSSSPASFESESTVANTSGVSGERRDITNLRSATNASARPPISFGMEWYKEEERSPALTRAATRCELYSVNGSATPGTLTALRSVSVLQNACVDFRGTNYFHSKVHGLETCGGQHPYPNGLHHYTWNPVGLEHGDLKPHNVVDVDGFGLVLDCWQQAWGEPNPMHQLMGLYQLVELVKFARERGFGEKIAWIGFRACQMRSTSKFSEYLTSQLLPLIIDDLRLSENATTSTIRFIDHAAPSTRSYLCFRKAALHTMYGMVPALPSSSLPTFPVPRRNEMDIGIFYRSQGTHLRRICNENDLLRLCQKLTSGRVSTLTSSSQMPMATQISNFDSVDVLLTTHGSQLAVLLFARRIKVVVEFNVAYYDPLGFDVAWSRKSTHIVSCSHLVADDQCLPDEGTQKLIEQTCRPSFESPRVLERSFPRCSPGAAQFVNRHLIINLNRTEDILVEALTHFEPK